MSEMKRDPYLPLLSEEEEREYQEFLAENGFEVPDEELPLRELLTAVDVSPPTELRFQRMEGALLGRLREERDASPLRQWFGWLFTPQKLVVGVAMAAVVAIMVPVVRDGIPDPTSPTTASLDYEAIMAQGKALSEAYGLSVEPGFTEVVYAPYGGSLGYGALGEVTPDETTDEKAFTELEDAFAELYFDTLG